MVKSGFHPFHIVTFSPWPVVISFLLFSLAMFSVQWLSKQISFYFLLVFVGFISLSLFSWWRDVCREGTFRGEHTLEVQKGLKLGFLLFILSEIMFFFSFFFGFISISSSIDVFSLGGFFPPKGVFSLSYLEIPLLNSILLLSSGVSVTWAHNSLTKSDKKNSVFPLFLTSFLGVIFLFLQGFEYYECSFSISDSVFGSLFFVMTGFHGLHVFVGDLFLLVSFFRLFYNQFSKNHHLGFEFSAWYWHFVDVVWLFLYLVVYWWKG